MNYAPGVTSKGGTTAAAIDRLVHHAVILELTGESFRTQGAKRKSGFSEQSCAGPD